MASLKGILNDCMDINTSGTVSVLSGMFGFFRGRVPTDPQPGVTASVSVLGQIRNLQERVVHLNVIRVGIDHFTADEIHKIDYAIYRARKIYSTVNLCVARVEHFDISSAAADGRDDLGSEDEAEDLTQEWTVPNDAVDIFLVDNISDSDFVGISPVGGPCDKDAKGMNGVVGGEVNRDFEGVARTFAHELGHYLGLSHTHDSDNCPTTTAGKSNLMTQTKCVDSVRDAVVLTSSQGSTVRGHCFTKDPC
jgi:hypothetical protein